MTINELTKIQAELNPEPYLNTDRKCECPKCEKAEMCVFYEKYQRLPRDMAPEALGLCPKLRKENRK